ncbi:BatD family protein [Flavobacterium sp.]|uniref:BatD family protein n=1 Tax=Flavobacterium sp. TaxID=239 RepID=UPI002B4ACCFA|nr:BatD family protein [Flavobacterium sp.]HLP63196.1 BatD family protein [Flavobacterium sp.]
MKRILIFIVLMCNSLLAQVQFEAKLSKSSLGINERLRVDFTMNIDGDNFTPPNFELSGFRIVGGPSQMVSQSWVNGRGTFNKSYSYVLMPLKKGNLVLKQATIEYNGQIYKTAPVKVNVGEAVDEQYDPYSNPRRQNQRAVTAVGKEGVHLVAEISNPNPYLNEPITIQYKIYVNSRTSVAGWRESAKPKYENFWSQSESIDADDLKVINTTFKGESYRMAVLRRTVLYPQKAGNLVIEPLTLDVEVEVPTGRVDLFGEAEKVIQNKRVSAGSKVINVKALPEAGKPADFTGAVGKFELIVLPSATTSQNGESIDLVVSVSGKGNLKLFDLPKPETPPALELYEPEHVENVTTTIAGMTGSISDKYTVVPQSKGNYSIKPIRFSYFDLESKSYKTLSSQNIEIKVLNDPSATIASKNSSKASGKQAVEVSKSFAYIKQKTNLKPVESDGFLGSGLFYSLLFLPLIAIPLLVFVRKRKEAQEADVAGNKLKRTSALAKKYLSEAKLHLNNKEQFYIALEKAMHNFLKAKLNIETSEMSKERITEILLSRKANSETVSQFIVLTENCEFARYAPSTSDTIQNDYDQAVNIISDLEKQIS